MKNDYTRGPYRNESGVIVSAKLPHHPIIATVNQCENETANGNLLAASYEMLNELKRLYKLHGYATTKAVIRKATKVSTP